MLGGVGQSMSGASNFGGVMPLSPVTAVSGRPFFATTSLQHCAAASSFVCCA